MYLKLAAIFIFTFSFHLYSFVLDYPDGIIDVNDKLSFVTKVSNFRSTEPVAIEVTVDERFYSEKEGRDVFRDTKDVVVIPSQIILPPNSDVNAIITYVGSKTFDSEKCYYVKFNQIDLNLFKYESTTGTERVAYLKAMVHYKKAMYVTDRTFQEKIVVEGVKFVYDVERPYIDVFLKNEGNKHKLVSGVLTVFDSPERSNVIEIEIRKQNLLPYSKKVKRFLWPDQFAKKQLFYDVTLK